MSHTPDYAHAGWLKYTVRTSELKNTVARCLPILKRYQFDAIAFRGMSGALIAPLLATHLDKAMILVRKPEHYTHSDHLVEGDRAARSYVIVDDFVSSGDTIKQIIKEIKMFARGAKCIGMLEVNYIIDPREDFRDHPAIIRHEDDLTLIDCSQLGV